MRRLTAARVAAALLLAALAFGMGLRAGRAGCEPDPPWEAPDYMTLTPDQLTWVIEGIQERISELEDDLDEAQRVMTSMLAVARPPPDG